MKQLFSTLHNELHIGTFNVLLLTCLWYFIGYQIAIQVSLAYATVVAIVPRLVKELNKNYIESLRNFANQHSVVTDDYNLATVKPIKDYKRSKDDNFDNATIKEIKSRDGYKCEFCGCNVLGAKTKIGRIINIIIPTRKNRLIEIDHVIPAALCGKPIFENGVVSCRLCNRKKSHRLRPPYLGSVLKLVEERQPNEIIWTGCIN